MRLILAPRPEPSTVFLSCCVLVSISACTETRQLGSVPRETVEQGATASETVVVTADDSQTDVPASNTFARRLPDGSYEIFTGRAIATAIAGREAPPDSHRDPYYRLRVPREVFDEAAASGRRARLISLEEPLAGVDFMLRIPIERSEALLSRATEVGPIFIEVIVKPGDPWTTGAVELQLPLEGKKDGSPTSGHDILFLVKGQDGNIGRIGWAGGSFRTPITEANLKYLGTRDQWPALPPHWQ